MRLIDADEFKKTLSKVWFWLEKIYDDGKTLTHSEVLDKIHDNLINQPTAFDIDKVIEELELHSFEFGNAKLPFHYLRLEDAIRIVKAGGVDEIRH